VWFGSPDVTDEVIDQYIQLQGAEPEDETAFESPNSEAGMSGDGESLVDFSRR
jgi:hypothetical protein